MASEAEGCKMDGVQRSGHVAEEMPSKIGLLNSNEARRRARYWGCGHNCEQDNTFRATA